MTILDIAGVDAIKRQYVSVRVDDLSLHLREGFLEAAAHKAARRLQETAALLNAPIFEADVVMHRKPRDEDTFTTELQFAWRPTNRPVELHGGPGHGEVLEVPNAPYTTVKVFLPPAPLWAEFHEAEAPVTTPEPLSYEYAGWNTTTRRWVYRLRKPPE
jgi:hypothetical protein